MAALVSVIIPTFNRSNLISETLTSVCCQSFTSLDIWVVDDGSTDGTREIVAEWMGRDRRVHLSQQVRKGASAARNLGFRKSLGNLVVFLDSDDLLAEDCIRNRVDALERRPEIDFVVRQGIVFRDEPGDQRILWNSTDSRPDNLSARFLAQDVPWQTSGPLWRRKSLEVLGPWCEGLDSFQDWEFHLRACLMGMKSAAGGPPDYFIRRSPREAQISSDHFGEKHIKARSMALVQIYQMLGRDPALKRNHEQAMRGYLIRNQLQLVDAGRSESCGLFSETEAGAHLLGFLDRRLIARIAKLGPDWRRHGGVVAASKMWWRSMPYDPWVPTSLLSTQWGEALPQVAKCS